MESNGIGITAGATSIPLGPVIAWGFFNHTPVITVLISVEFCS